jgi:hypothetical protein
MRNDFGKMGNDVVKFGNSINTSIQSYTKILTQSGLFGGKRSGGGGGGGGGGETKAIDGDVSGTALASNGVSGSGSGGMSESGSAINSGIPSALSHISDMTGTNSSSIIPLAIGVAVVGYFIFSKKK